MNQKASSLIDIVNLFKPLALTGKQVEFYQPTSVVRDGTPYEFHDGLYNRVVSATGYERLLVVGHGGCGKSTELNMLISKLSSNNYPAIHVKAGFDLDLYTLPLLDYS